MTSSVQVQLVGCSIAGWHDTAAQVTGGVLHLRIDPGDAHLDARPLCLIFALPQPVQACVSLIDVRRVRV